MYKDALSGAGMRQENRTGKALYATRCPHLPLLLSLDAAVSAVCLWRKSRVLLKYGGEIAAVAEGKHMRDLRDG